MNDEKNMLIEDFNNKNMKIAEKIISSETVDEIKDLTSLFNLNFQKKNALRIMKMNDLLDKVTDQIVERFERNPNLFTNDDLLKYMQVTETSIDRANKNLNLIEETPPIQVMNQNQVNININNNDLNRDSRRKVIEVVQSLLEKSNEIISENNVHNNIDIEEQE